MPGSFWLTTPSVQVAAAQTPSAQNPLSQSALSVQFVPTGQSPRSRHVRMSESFARQFSVESLQSLQLSVPLRK